MSATNRLPTPRALRLPDWEISVRKRSVCRLARADGAVGTGFVVAFDQSLCLMTNHHVLPGREYVAGAKAWFDDDGSDAHDASENAGWSLDLTLASDTMFLYDQDLDYAICSLSKESLQLLNEQRVRALPVSKSPVRLGDTVVLVQHPDGRGRELSIDSITDLFSSFVTYQCETAAGSSGSPVLRAWEVVHTSPDIVLSYRMLSQSALTWPASRSSQCTTSVLPNKLAQGGATKECSSRLS